MYVYVCKMSVSMMHIFIIIQRLTWISLIGEGEMSSHLRAEQPAPAWWWSSSLERKEWWICLTGSGRLWWGGLMGGVSGSSEVQPKLSLCCENFIQMWRRKSGLIPYVMRKMSWSNGWIYSQFWRAWTWWPPKASWSASPRVQWGCPAWPPHRRRTCPPSGRPPSWTWRRGPGGGRSIPTWRPASGARCPVCNELSRTENTNETPPGHSLCCSISAN